MENSSVFTLGEGIRDSSSVYMNIKPILVCFFIFVKGLQIDPFRWNNAIDPDGR